MTGKGVKKNNNTFWSDCKLESLKSNRWVLNIAHSL